MQNDFKPVVGHAFSLRMEPQPNWNGIIDCQVREVEPNKTLSYAWGALGLESIVTFTLTPTSTGTHLRMEQIGFRPGPAAELSGRQVRLAAVHRQAGAGSGARGVEAFVSSCPARHSSHTRYFPLSPLAGEGGELRAKASDEPGEGALPLKAPLTRPRSARAPSPASGRGEAQQRHAPSNKEQITIMTGRDPNG